MSIQQPIIMPGTPAFSSADTSLKFHTDLEQGSDEWKAARCGLLTASEMHLIVRPPPKAESRVKKDGTPFKQREPSAAENKKEKTHLYELLAQRITGHVEPTYYSAKMLRGHEDEVDARIAYSNHYGEVIEVGFITTSRFGFTLGYSPDGLVGEDGLIEVKSRDQKYQIETITECVEEETIPDEYILQIQSGLLITRRKWCDFISYSGGLHMVTIRVYPDLALQDSILEAAGDFERRLAEKQEKYRKVLSSKARLIPTERRIEQEMFV